MHACTLPPTTQPPPSTPTNTNTTNHPHHQARVHPTTATPVTATLLTAASAALLAGLINIEVLAQLVSVGTLVVFGIVCAGVLAR